MPSEKMRLITAHGVRNVDGQWSPLVVNLTEEHQSLLRLLGKSYERLYR